MNISISGRLHDTEWDALIEYYNSHKELEEDFKSFEQWVLDMALYKFDEDRAKEARK